MYIIFIISLFLFSNALNAQEIDLLGRQEINILYIYEDKNLNSNEIKDLNEIFTIELDEVLKNTYGVSAESNFNFKEKMNLVGAIPYPDYVTANNSLRSFSFFSDNSGAILKEYYKELNFIIEETKANVVVFLSSSKRDDGKTKGAAQIMNIGNGDYSHYKSAPQLLFSLKLIDNYKDGQLTFSHELGHLLGGVHSDESNGIFPFSKSYGGLNS